MMDLLQLRPYLGKRVTRAWAPSGEHLAVLLEDATAVQFQLEERTDGGVALRCMVGKAKTGSVAYIKAMDARFPRRWDGLDALVGQPFTGIEDNVITFGNIGVTWDREGMVFVERDDTVN